MIGAARPDAADRRAAAGEAGYALVTAVIGIGVFALLALALATHTRAAIAGANAEISRARAGHAADAGFVLAAHGLLTRDPAVLNSLDGRPYTASFDGAELTITIQPEAGQVPLHQLDEERVTRLLEGAGLGGQELAIARDSLLDWLDDDEMALPDGAEAAFYAPQGFAPRNGNLNSVDELRRVRGFTPALVERLRPYVTANTAIRMFDNRVADPRAIAVMEGSGAGSVAAIVRAREQAGQRAALAFGTGDDLVGEPMLVRVTADLGSAGRAQREAVLILTRSARQPYVLRDYR